MVVCSTFSFAIVLLVNFIKANGLDFCKGAALPVGSAYVLIISIIEVAGELQLRAMRWWAERRLPLDNAMLGR